MKRISLLILLLLTFKGFSQQKINNTLKKQLDSILFTDQVFREYADSQTTERRKEAISKLTNRSRESLNTEMWAIMNETDSMNLVKVKDIISEFGYPGRSLVGEPTNTAAFYVIQHSDKIEKYFPLIDSAGKSGELPYKFAAMMLDRKLVKEGKAQVYGTQIVGKKVINKTTGKETFFMYVHPIKKAGDVNKRRKEAGIETTVEANAIRFGVIYKNFTFKELKRKMQKLEGSEN